MCDPVSIGMAVAGVALQQLTKPKAPKMPKVEAVQPAVQQQADKAASFDQLKSDRAAKAMGSGYDTNQSTLLTGPEGVDANSLNLGKSVLLGN